MGLSQVQLLQINKQVDRILHTMGNQPKANGQLEIAFVIDGTADKIYIIETAKAIALSLKKHDRVFENVRCNVVDWENDGKCSTRVVPLAFIAMGKITENSAQAATDIQHSQEISGNSQQTSDELLKNRNLENVTSYLKMFHARSKCIILITQGDFVVENRDKFVESMTPFLKTKLLIVKPEEIVAGSRFLADFIIER